MTSSSPIKPSARALASRRNGARSRGPATEAGRAASSRNALKHGLRAAPERARALLDDEDAAAFDAFAAALRAELAPEGALQAEARGPEEPGVAALLPPLPQTTKRTREPQESWALAVGGGRPGAGD